MILHWLLRLGVMCALLLHGFAVLAQPRPQSRAVKMFAPARGAISAQVEAELRATGYLLEAFYGPLPSAQAIVRTHAETRGRDGPLIVEIDLPQAQVRVWATQQGEPYATRLPVVEGQERVLALRVVEALRAFEVRLSAQPEPTVAAVLPIQRLAADDAAPERWSHHLSWMVGGALQPHKPVGQPSTELEWALDAEAFGLWLAATLPLWRHTIDTERGQLRWAHGLMLVGARLELFRGSSWSGSLGAGGGGAATHIEGTPDAQSRGGQDVALTPAGRLQGSLWYGLGQSVRLRAYVATDWLYPVHRALVQGSTGAQQGPAVIRAALGVSWQL